MNAIDPSHQLPIVKSVDVLILGGTSGAITLALEAKQSGLSVFVVAPRTYLGEDICGAYRFWPAADHQQEDALADGIFAAPKPPTPLRVKTALEQALVDADIPFLFNTSPAGLLRDAEGRISGAVIAHRGGRQGVRARMVVDATLDGLVLEQAGSPVHRPQGEQSVTWVTVTEGEGRSAEGIASERLPGYEFEEMQLAARRYQLTVDFGDGSPAARGKALNQAMRVCWTPEEFRCQSALRPALPATDAQPALRSLMMQPGLLAFTEAAQLSAGAEYIFTDPARSLALGRNLGSALQSILPPKYTGPLTATCAGAVTVESGEIRALAQGLRPNDPITEAIQFDASSAPVLGEYDVVVVGGGTGGAPAAIGAARAGASTLALEACSALGGVGTVGQIGRYWYGNRVGFTSEIDKGVAQLEPKKKFQGGKGAWSVSAKAHWFLETGASEGAEYWLNTFCVGTWIVDNAICGVLVAGPNGYGLVKAKAVIDSTGCADVIAATGTPTRVIGKDHVAVQGVGLAGIKPDRDYQNSDHSFSDDTDVVDATAFFVSSRKKFPNDFDSGELVDSRERRQIFGDYSITAVDILFQRRFPDTICVASSNFDTHGFTIDPSFMVIPPNKDRLWADVPLRCLLPQGLEGVMATGLGVSAHRDALPVIRMQPDVQNHGYAAGYLGAISARTGQKLRDIDVKEVQRHLVEIGSLPERVLTDEDTFPVADEVLAEQVANGWDQASGVALILREKDRSLPLLRQAYNALGGERTAQSLRYAQLIALMGDNQAQAEIAEKISNSEWDTGWNYTGMGQFGMSMSPLDGLIVALAESGDASAWPVILEKIATLQSGMEFSHFRAVGMACEVLNARHPNPEAAAALAALLDLPGITGHALTSQAVYNAAVDEDMCNTQTRNVSLIELHLARALYNCGDADGRAAAILSQYAQDLRGHFARHAAALLASDTLSSETGQVLASRS
ncbi:FAD-dependent oxidoreductase [Cerasicoccus fimbriatus]|uniref:FAD-dependent oxidoreductase n=1 Tax=Cerasicoccus fimbriatus TaxID=3014554 RepID=UPI0022B3B793|nr:FAD-dependent oxidoreductase [Cerasicoccus sp. TK19100]